MLKYLIFLFFPTQILIEIFLAGLILIWFTKKQRLGKILIAVGFFLFVFFNSAPFSNFLLGRLEYKYSPLITDSDSSFLADEIDYIVVLGATLNYNEELSTKIRISPAALARLVEGVRLYKNFPEKKLIFSGKGRYEMNEAEMMSKMAVELGVEKKDIIIESESSNTYEEAVFLKEILGKDKFFLVTSARHMPRAMAIFKKMEMDPVAAPTDYLIGEIRGYDFYEYLARTSEAFYEYFGLIKEKLLGHI